MRLSNLRIGPRLALGFGAVLALSVLLVALATNRLNTVLDALERAATYERRATLMSDWVSRTELNVVRAVAISKAGGQDDVANYFAPQIRATSDEISKIQAELEGSISSTRGKALVARIADVRKAYLATRTKVADLMRSGDLAGGQKVLEEQMLPAAATYLATMRELKAFQDELADADNAALEASLKSGRVMLLVILVVALAVGAGMAYAITRSVTRPLGEAVGAAQVMASGDLSKTVESDARDEAGDLLRSLGAMQRSLRDLVGQVRASTDSINTASVEIASGNRDLSARTEQTASNLQEAASSMEQITGNVRQSADSARQANQLASSAAEVAAKGGQVAAQVVSTMQEITDSSRRIADIIGVIDGIAFQTNILALNAAVEAARAGEQGRGFAVVAGEVRSLAQRSAEAAREIKALIGSSVDKVESGSKLVSDAGQTMNEIVASVQRVSDIIGEISAAASEQSDGIVQVNSAVTQLDQATQQNAALVEQSAAAAQSLKDQAQRLVDAVGVFRLGAG